MTTNKKIIITIITLVVLIIGGFLGAGEVYSSGFADGHTMGNKAGYGRGYMKGYIDGTINSWFNPKVDSIKTRVFEDDQWVKLEMK